MKCISKEDLNIIVKYLSSDHPFDLDDFIWILAKYGDEYIFEDGQYKKLTDNEIIKYIRQSDKKE